MSQLGKGTKHNTIEHVSKCDFLFLGPYLASLNLDRHLLDCEKGDKSDEKTPSKFGVDNERSGMDTGNKTGGNR